MKAHILMHEEFESPAAILKWCATNNIETTYTRFYLNETLPPEPTDQDINFDLLFVMGGPQSPATTKQECPYYNAKSEINFIKKCVEKDISMLGVCLGAQLIGEALGAKFDHSPNREIGVFPLTLTDEAKSDPTFKNFESSFDVGHWHGDMPGLTNDAKILAYSDGCPRQVVKYSPKIYGFQCHFEFTLDAINGMIETAGHEIEQYKDLPYIESPEELRSHDYYEMNKKLFDFLDYLKSTVE